MKTFRLSLDQGYYGVDVTLVLPDGIVVSADYREDRESWQATEIVEWSVLDYTDREVELCRRIIAATDTSAFDAKVREFFDDHLAESDAQ